MIYASNHTQFVFVLCNTLAMKAKIGREKGGCEDLRSSRSNVGVAPMLADMWQVGKYHVGGHILVGSGHDKH
jgi:hypothetical protein